MKYPIHPKECLNLRIRMATRVINRIFDKYSRQLGVSPSQQTILLLVDAKEAIHQSEIGKELSLERSTVTRELKGLIDKGYLQKEGTSISPLVSLTEQGKIFMQELIPSWTKANREVAALLGKKGVAAIGELFQSIQ
jgi:DNA-binding MarR family transcriptional regulator